MVSSYTPNLNGLLRSPSNLASGNVVAIGLETYDGYAPLPCVGDEIREICRFVDAAPFVSLQNENATIESVVESLRTASVLHLACHAEQDAENSLDSSIILHDGKLKLIDIMPVVNPNASFVYLSACQTAMGDSTLPDEAMHVAGAMLFSGFKSAIATMW